MGIYFVNQGDTFKYERDGGYVWAPKLASNGHNNIGFLNMKKIKKDDIILHNNNGKISAISIAKDECYDFDMPKEYKKSPKTASWNDDGYRIDTEYKILDTPLPLSSHKKWLKEHSKPKTAFNKNGSANQVYMNVVTDEQAIFLLKEALEIQTTDSIKVFLKCIIDEITDEVNPEYDEEEKETIDELIDTAKPFKSSGIKPQKTSISSATSREKANRDKIVAASALVNAEYKCEYDTSDRTFLRKNGKPYTEPHHLIPISKYKDFPCSIDITQNVVSLCSHCHNLLHYGRFEDKKVILEKLYNDRKDDLKSMGVDISLEDLEGYYK